jgi:MoxR-like ATPase
MNETPHDDRLDLGRRFNDEVLAPMKQAFVGKDEIIDLLGVCLVARENLFLLGPPGTAKSALVQDLARRIEGNVFDYLLTRFTEPNEVFGPFDIRRLREGELVTNTEGMLPEATFIFLDELLNANSAILNSLLLVLNERIFRRGRETRSLPTLMVVGASNRLPEDDALGALFDRFLLRVHCDNVGPEQLPDVLMAGWKLDIESRAEHSTVSIDDIERLHGLLRDVDFTEVRAEYVELIHRLRHAGIGISDRRAVKLQRVLAASAIFCGRLTVNVTDMWVLRYIWDTEEQQDVLASIVGDAVNRADESEKAESHLRSRGVASPDPEHLAKDLERISARLDSREVLPTERSYLQDQLGVLASRCQWVEDEQQRVFLESSITALLDKVGGKA